MTGKVYLVGAGPGDPKLITLRAIELLKELMWCYMIDWSAKNNFYDSKAYKAIYVGRAVGDDTRHQDGTNELMVKYAKLNKKVVRLKGGDPIIFGRGGEEFGIFKSFKVKYEIVPGITSGIGSATYAGIPLTHRKYASSVVFVTGHEDPEKNEEIVKWKKLAKSVDTIVIMMGLSRIGIISKQLIAGGMKKSTPVAVIQNGTTPKQKMIVGTLTSIAGKIKKENGSSCKYNYR